MLTLKRRPDWPERLNRALAEHRKGAFEWGQFDCGILFSDVVWAMTDTDPMEVFGRWRTEHEALRAVVRSGHSSVKAYLDSVLPQIPVARARRGDVGYAEGVTPISCPAIVTGAEAQSRDERGWLVFPTSRLTTAYRIG